MRAGIITLCDPQANYGNRLQNYALQEVLKKLNIEVTTYSCEGEEITSKDKMHKFLHAVTFYKFTKDKNVWTNGYKRRVVFKKFNDDYVNIMQITSLEGLENKEDYFVLGSDQVWNYKWYGDQPLKKELFLLTFARDEQKICFAPSFGVDKIADEWKNHFKKNLQSIKYLSVREEAGEKIIEDLTGRTCPVVIDPTMMLSADEWRKIEEKPQKVDTDKKYILTYFLGEKDDKANEYLKNISEKYHLKIYNLLDYKQPDIYITGPSEFLYLIDNAAMVFTDSFHACVFSVLFNKPFLVFERKLEGNNMNSRIETFLKKFNLERKYVDNFEIDNAFEHDYSVGYDVLKKERDKTTKFLYNAFNMN